MRRCFLGALLRLIPHPNRNAFLDRWEICPTLEDLERVEERLGVDLRRCPAEVRA